MDEEARLLNEHKERLARRRANKEALQQLLLNEFLHEVDSTQRNFLIANLHFALQNLIRRKENVLNWKKKWNTYEKSWLDMGVESINIELWFDLGIDDAQGAAKLIEICSQLGTSIDPNKPFNRYQFTIFLESKINNLMMREKVALFVEMENLQLIHLDSLCSNALFALHLAYETGRYEPPEECKLLNEKWVLAENVLNGRGLPENISHKKINNLDLAIIDYAIENGKFTGKFLDQITDKAKRNYFLARYEPDSKYITNAVVSELQWRDEELRRRFILGDYSPDMESVPQLKNLQKLRIGIDFDLATVIDISENPQLNIKDRITALDIVQFVEFGDLNESLEKDTDTWKILWKLAPEHCFQKADALSRVRFRRWCFVRMLQFFVLTNNLEEYEKKVTDELIRALYDNKPLKAEIFTGFAFLHLRHGNRIDAKKRFQDAFNLIDNIITRHNLNLIKLGGFNIDRLNPYVVAQIEHDVSEEQWRRQLNQLRADAAREGSEREIHLNWAKGMNDPHVKGLTGDREKTFRYPAIPHLYLTEPAGTFLHPPARSIERRYFLEESIGGIREEAFADMLPQLLHTLKIDA